VNLLITLFALLVGLWGLGQLSCGPFLVPESSGANVEAFMSVNSMGGSSGLNVSPYLASALSRIQASGLSTTPASETPPASNAASTPQTNGEPASETRVLSSQMIGALVAMQMDDNTAQPGAANSTETGSDC
jgi:hypothetical protein